MPDTSLGPVAPLACFKAYDIRGRLPDELNEDVAYRVGRAFVEELGARRVVVGRDVRLSSPALLNALVRGITDGGADAYDIGLAGTEEIYFNTFHHAMDGGIVVTASHNPMDYNGMKLVREGSRPISGDTGLLDVKARAEAGAFAAAAAPGERHELTDKTPYIDHLLRYVDVTRLKPLKVVVNAGNGGAGVIVDLLEGWLPFEFIKVHHEPDGSFPNGIPNPLLPDNRAATVEAIRRSGADLGVAWDGDFDRCFLFDEQGGFIEGYYIVGLLAELFLRKEPGARVIHDPRLTWNTIDIVTQYGGVPIQSKTGHAFIKERMRLENAVYGGEMSAHHYFRDFAYCDSGMIPWLVVAELMGREDRTLSSLVGERQALYPVSGEINRRIPDPAAAIAAVQARYGPEARVVEQVDGLSMAFDEWRFNLRTSNTEPLLRLNVETRGDRALMGVRTAELLDLIDATAAGVRASP